MVMSTSGAAPSFIGFSTKSLVPNSSNDDYQKNEKDKDETYRIDAASIYARHANSSL
ncbi:hypothetical protein PghCCS26_27380 [Paenibacillus glycanilyticus]|uniref:Uncharacterized protein n=1 Tax=Paenibacillus glycanilyticus TaxID=126569 RepID=A0ABQ6NM52_9BACL|nr:hypothetical protein PghCCS26_27380 [Paenibacillus glycanilyticus]